MPRFGLTVEPQIGYDYGSLERMARAAEEAGCDSFWSSDHLFSRKSPSSINALEPWVLLASLATRTNKIRLGTLVTCNSFRHPPLLAKIVASLDNISEGRVFFGIGSGWAAVEYEAYGYPFPSLKTRMDQLEEALQIIKKMWTEEKPSYKGRYYSIKNALCTKPAQKPHPPILIGGNSKRALKLAAKYGDYCNVWYLKNLKERLGWLRKICEDEGRDYSSIGKSFSTAEIHVAETAGELEAESNRRAKVGALLDPLFKKQFADVPGSWVGYPEDLIERFNYLMDLGFDYFHVYFFQDLGDKAIAMSRRFAKKIMEKL